MSAQIKSHLSTLWRHKGKALMGSTVGLFGYGMFRADEVDEPPRRVGSRLPVSDSVKDHHSATLRNRVWTEEELKQKWETVHQHEERSSGMDYLTYGVIRGLYHSFNTVTGFDHDDPTVESMKLRLILLESIAGVPPFIMAGYRHFRALRKLTYDGGRIYTHLEEAENERMHLISCMQIFEASWKTTAAVYGAQLFITPFCWFFCLANPRWLNRFVGYLEETACETYGTVLRACNDPSKKLYKEWHDKPAPPAAIQYWQLPENATWPDALLRIYADETQHRDINHTFANISIEARNPLLHHHHENLQRVIESEITKKSPPPPAPTSEPKNASESIESEITEKSPAPPAPTSESENTSESDKKDE